MSVLALEHWQTPGCGRGCHIGYHDPSAHEHYGYSWAMRDRNSVGIRTGVLLVNVDSRDVQVNGRSIRLSPIERSMTVYLASRIGEMVTRGEILSAVWGEEYAFWSAESILRANINRLRGKLGAAAPLLETVIGHGYRLRQEVPA
jgi:DNA-binding response OmpR family regulator